MHTPRAFATISAFFSCALICFKTQAGPLTYSVSGDSNPAGVFGIYPQTYWNSGDIALPSGTIIGSTPLQIDLTLSHNVTLNNAASGTETLNFGMWFGSTQLPAGVDAGSVEVELLEGSTVLTSSPLGFDAGTFPFPLLGYDTQRSFSLPQNLVFNGVDIFLTDSAPNGIAPTDIEIGLPSVQGVPDGSNTLLLLFLVCGIVVGLSSGRVPAFCRRVCS
jgi:hypothetical protein